ncbi:hypothetical protein BTM25_36870 [Actinomadura rubteroloni]|uniref:Lytic transglycosylase domain-containing protein n=1 Tax=Actinomadura rubteroloni TaxID=1926885 RepID=A0A2P4UJ02_9ACTN|nr:hypothetical protein [Actinomadura rubteroloni]POM25045.1 hypothetical protein BTM25_36870 [Actinomadura rubteroloni]
MPQSHGTRGRSSSRARGGNRRRGTGRPRRGPAPHATPDAHDVLPSDLYDEPRRPLAVRILTHNATIAGGCLALVATVTLVLDPSTFTGHKAQPPASVRGLSANEMLDHWKTSDMDPIAANIVANAKERAYKEQEAELARLRAKAKRDAAARAKLEAIRKREEERKRLARMNPSAGQNKAFGQKMNAARGWGRCWPSLLTLWNHESGWNERAMNAGSGAYGIPQALPGSKLASAGPDWRTSSPTQIAWGLGYIKARYHDPCGAWAWWSSHHWY